jgi:hypothetical protein
LASKISGKDKQIKKGYQLKDRFNKSILDNDIIAHYFERKNSKNEDIITP